MKRNLSFTGIILSILICMQILNACSSCNRANKDDLSSLAGTYQGKASLVLPDGLKTILQRDTTTKISLPEAVTCKIKATVNDKNELELQLEEFDMPAESIHIEPMKCTVTSTEGIFSIEGKGSVTTGNQKTDYSQKGSIKNKNMNLEITIPIIPMVMEAKILFDGKKI